MTTETIIILVTAVFALNLLSNIVTLKMALRDFDAKIFNALEAYDEAVVSAMAEEEKDE